MSAAREMPGLPAIQDPPGLRAPSVLPDQPDLRALQAIPDRLDLKARRALPDRTGLLVPQVLPDQPDLLVPRRAWPPWIWPRSPPSFSCCWNLPLLQELPGADLSESRREDSERLDNLIHLLIENTRDPAFKERLNSLDREIHRVFEAAAAAAPDQETAQTVELMEGIVVLSSIMDAIAEARIAAAAMPPASVPPKWEPDEYTEYIVKAAISKYDSEGLDATVAHYNTRESIDGQWYMFILDQDDILLAHAANPDFVGRPASGIVGPNNYPTAEAVVAVADEDGAWFTYPFHEPCLGRRRDEALLDGRIRWPHLRLRLV